MSSAYERGFDTGYLSGSFFHWIDGLNSIINWFKFAKIREENERIMRYNAQVDYVNAERHREMERLGVDEYCRQQADRENERIDRYNLWVQEENARVAARNAEVRRHNAQVSAASDDRSSLLPMCQ